MLELNPLLSIFQVKSSVLVAHFPSSYVICFCSSIYQNQCLISLEKNYVLRAWTIMRRSETFFNADTTSDGSECARGILFDILG